jgi:hypothetical protein
MRQGMLQYTAAPVFYLPLAFLGCPPSLFSFHQHFNRVYQFPLHTCLVDKLPGWFEYVFNTPSHHRVHHGTNPQYLDKNYGGTLILFDRWFGTFEPEQETVVYGLTSNVQSWSAMWHNLQHWDYMYKLAGKLPGWHKLRVLWKGPAWMPKEGADLYVKKPEVGKYDVDMTTLTEKVWIACKIGLVTLVNKRMASIEYDARREGERWWWVMWTVGGVYALGWYLEGDKARARTMDALWLVSGAVAALGLYVNAW